MMDPFGIAPAEWAAARARSANTAAAWHRGPERRALAALFDDRAATDPDLARDRARDLLADSDFARRLLAPLVAALASDPLFEPPIRVSRRGGRIAAVLFDTAAAWVGASVLPARHPGTPKTATVVVPGRLSVTRYVRAGGARIRRWRVTADRAEEIAPLLALDGEVHVHDGRAGGHVIGDAAGDVVTLNVVLRAGAISEVREYRIADGSRIRTASADDAASRTAMLLTLLRIQRRADAPDVFDIATRDASAHARWGAMREWLALDADAALPRLGEMAGADADAEVRTLARATRELVERKRALCLA